MFTWKQYLLAAILYLAHWLLNNVPALAKLKSLESTFATKIENEVDAVVLKTNSIVTTVVGDARKEITNLKNAVLADKQPPVVQTSGFITQLVPPGEGVRVQAAK